MINKIKKLKLPVIIGLILGGLDLAIWIWFLAYWFLNRQELFLSEGLFGMMVLHFPASFLLPLLGSILVFIFNLFFQGAVDHLVPQTMFLFIVGIAQYYFIGYFIGWLIVKLRRRFGFDKSMPESKEKPKSGRIKVWGYNILCMLFTILILQMLMDIVSGVMLDFEMYKMNYPPTRHYLELAIFIMWLYSTYRIIHYNKKNETIKKVNQKLLIASISIVVLFIAIYIPKLFISDIPKATALEGVYANQQAKIFFDNPLERLIIMKTAIVGMDEKTYQVAAYTFLGLKYRLTDIEKVSEYEMRLLLNPSMQKRQHEAQAGVVEILNRTKHPRWPRVAYSELMKDGRFSLEKIQGIISGINNANSLFFQTDHDEYEVYLLIYLEDAYTNVIKKDFVFEDSRLRPEYIINTKDVKISKAHYDSVLGSYRIEYMGHPYYMIFDVLSDQGMPADIDHIWDPDHNAKESDIWQILKSITGEVLDQKYFDENLKMSFTYPDNFYIENDALGPNFDIVITPFASVNPDHDNPEGFIYTSLTMKKVLSGAEHEKLMADYEDKARNREFYPDYFRESLEINGQSAELIKYNDAFSGGMVMNVLLDADDYNLRVSYFDDTAYSDDYKQIIESIAIWSSITDELLVRFQTATPDIGINYPEESFLWWDDEDGYSIIVPGTESIEIAKDGGIGAENFVQINFTRDILDITDEVLSARGFVLNERNSSSNKTDRKFYDYVQAYENDDELCVVRVDPDYSSSGCTDNMFMCNTIEITCGNDLVGSQEEQRPFLEALELQNKETVATFVVQDGPFYRISMHARRTGSAAILKKEGDDYRVLYIGQEGPPCELMDKEEIPASVFKGIGDGSCFSDTGYRCAEENNY